MRASVIARSNDTAHQPPHRFLPSTTYGKGRVVVSADSDLFGDDCIDDVQPCTAVAQHRLLDRPPDVRIAGRTTHHQALPTTLTGWTLKEATERLRAVQAADGTVDLGEVSVETLRDIVDRMSRQPSPAWPRTFRTRRSTWRRRRPTSTRGSTADVASPTSGPSLALFRPEQQRADGIEHLVFFPMYTPNGSLDTRFEALIVRVPWPTLDRTTSRARRSATRSSSPCISLTTPTGYDSECAVLFPETVSVVGAAANTFGGIFCDREAARYQRVVVDAVVESPRSTCHRPSRPCSPASP